VSLVPTYTSLNYISKCKHLDMLCLTSTGKQQKTFFDLLMLGPRILTLEAFCVESALTINIEGAFPVSRIEHLTLVKCVGLKALNCKLMVCLRSLRIEKSVLPQDLSFIGSDHSSLQNLTLSKCEGLESLNGLNRSVKELHIHGCFNLRDIDVILGKGFFELTNLTFISNTNVREIKFSNAVNEFRLKQVVLCNIRNLSRLSDFTICNQLVDLNLKKCVSVCNLNFLSGCVRLRNLIIDNCYQIFDLSPLEALENNLISLSANWCRNIVDARPLLSCQKLRWISLRGLTSMLDFTCLVRMTCILDRLDLKYNYHIPEAQFDILKDSNKFMKLLYLEEDQM